MEQTRTCMMEQIPPCTSACSQDNLDGDTMIAASATIYTVYWSNSSYLHYGTFKNVFLLLLSDWFLFR